MLDEAGLNEVTLRDKRYDLVIHMVTAANGAEEFYGIDNNEARREVIIFNQFQNYIILVHRRSL